MSVVLATTKCQLTPLLQLFLWKKKYSWIIGFTLGRSLGDWLSSAGEQGERKELEIEMKEKRGAGLRNGSLVSMCIRDMTPLICED